MNIIEVTCMNKGCNNKFRVPEFKFNSTIKNNPKKQECNICKNRKLLAQSTFARKNKRTEDKSGKYTIKINNGKKRLKTPRERFYSSTAWKYFSRYILMYYSLDGIMVRCCTSGRFMKVNSQKCHVGHFVKVFDGNSTNYAVAFDFINVGPQSMQDNTFRGGRQDVMYQWLVSEHGKEEVDNLFQKKHEVFRLDDATLNEIAREYKEKFDNLLVERGWKNPWKN